MHDTDDLGRARASLRGGQETGKYAQGLGVVAANEAPLSPVSLVKRTAKAYPNMPAIDFDGVIQSWGETFARCLRLAGGLRRQGVTANSTVAVLCRNLPAAVELSYAVPMSRGVLNMINTRLDAEGVAFILDHGEAEVLFVDSGLEAVAREALALAKAEPLVIGIEDPRAPFAEPPSLGYEAFLAASTAVADDDILPIDERAALALNYTSGTTGNPKGVVYHHRGAYLNAVGNTLEWSLPLHPRYLWTLPLFHCNGWCFPWTVAAKAGLNVCLRGPTGPAVLDAIEAADITHMCGAPIVLNMATTEAEARGTTLGRRIEFMTAGAAPPAAVLARADAVGFSITHVYGLTEVYGPCAVCAWRTEWDDLDADERARLRARQGVNYVVLEELSVRDPETLEEVPADGETMGEVMFQGNVVMSGYLKNPDATDAAFAGGHFRSGDLGVRHPDGHVELKDRSKDIIISGGENISSIEVEGVLYRHPAVAEAAVVAAPDEKWGETPVAFIEKRPDAQATPEDIIAFCRDQLAHFKCPTRVEFTELPKTVTGKIQKFELRKRVV
ncbi:MAG: AMP-binding protein [Pseudomonadota bacterium]